MKLYKKEIRIGLYIWGVFLLGLLILGTLFTVSRIRNDKIWTDAQVVNIGKPIIYEQYYHTK